MIDPSRLERVPEYAPVVGGFGIVRVAKFDKSLLVAVKEIRLIGTDDDRARFAIVRCALQFLACLPNCPQRFARELKVWAPLDHPNLLKLSGYYMDPEMTIAHFICPFYEHGHIGKYLEIHQPNQEARLNFVCKIEPPSIIAQN